MYMKARRFGIEVELTGLTRKAAADIAAANFGTTAVYDGSYYDTYSPIDAQGRKWKFMSDASITPRDKACLFFCYCIFHLILGILSATLILIDTTIYQKAVTK